MAILTGKLEQVVFIVSSGRTGTTALAQHLDRCYENVCALHEPRPSWRLRRASARALAGRLTTSELVAMLAGARRDLVARLTQPIYIESNPFLGGFLEAFGQVFDHPRIVHIVRDPRTFIRSSINFGTFRGLKNLASSLLPWWLPKPEQFAHNPYVTWARMSQVERLAWYWGMLNTELNRGQEIYGDHYLRMRFEDLFAKDGSGLRILTDWIGLPRNDNLLDEANRENVNASKATKFPRWKDWPDQYRDEVLRHCGLLMEMYGYRPDVEGTVAASPKCVHA